MFTRFFTNPSVLVSSLTSFGICSLLASMRKQMLQQRMPAAEVDSALDLVLIYLTVKTSPSVIPGVFMNFVYLCSAMLSEHQNTTNYHKIKNACALGLYFVCGDDLAIEYKAAKFICTAGASWLGYNAVDKVCNLYVMPQP